MSQNKLHFVGFNERNDINWFWDKKKEMFLGRTVIEWIKFVLYYLAFYTVLALLYTFCWFVFSTTLSPDHPKFTDIVQCNPAVNIRPQPQQSHHEYGVLHVQTSEPDEWVNELDGFLKGSKQKFTECKREDSFGYKSERPCIILKLNKILYWMPDCYVNPNDLPDDMPESLKSHIKERAANSQDMDVVWVSCDGHTEDDKKNLGNVSYESANGEQGFAGRYFPFKNSDDYEQPLVAMKFMSSKSGVPIRIKCKAWAKNINNNLKEQAGMGLIELRID